MEMTGIYLEGDDHDLFDRICTDSEGKKIVKRASSTSKHVYIQTGSLVTSAEN
jgi:hypothetical protein